MVGVQRQTGEFRARPAAVPLVAQNGRAVLAHVYPELMRAAGMGIESNKGAVTQTQQEFITGFRRTDSRFIRPACHGYAAPVAAAAYQGEINDPRGDYNDTPLFVSTPTEAFKPGEILIKVKSGTSAAWAKDAMEQYGVTSAEPLIGGGLVLWQVPKGSELETIEQLIS